jgi:hypothetical protein
MTRAVVKCGLWAVLTVSVLVLIGCQDGMSFMSAKDRGELFNGKDFSGWVRFLPDPTADVNDVWRVRDGVIVCAGRPNGYIRTEKKYKNYHLQLQWRWVKEPTNSGVLLHAQEPDQVWPKCIECQLKAGNAGDFVLIGGTGVTVGGVDHQDPDRQFVVVEKMAPTSEEPAGQWNTYDIHCKGDSIRCYVNGVLQNEGTDATPSSGYICLQSEGSPIEFRNIRLLSAN